MSELVAEKTEVTISGWRGNPAESAAKESSRYAICGVQPVVGTDSESPDSGYIVGTDGRQLSVATAIVARSGGYPLPLPILDLGLFTAKKLPIFLNGHEPQITGKRGETISFAPVEGRFPPCHDVLPDLADKAGAIDPARYTAWISFDVDLLMKIAKSLAGSGDHKVTIGIEAPTKPIIVLDNHTDGFGLLMPLSQDHATYVAKPAESYQERRQKFVAAWSANNPN